MTVDRPIRTEADYRAPLAEIERLIDAPEGSAEAERLELISVLVADYEDRYHEIEAPDPISFLQFVMESRGLTRKDLEPFIGSRARVAEVLNRKRVLSMEMVRRLTSGLDLPAHVLIQPYDLSPAKTTAKSRGEKVRPMSVAVIQ
jgi:HTH-type transcriptional regulator / antitoxin HigA